MSEDRSKACGERICDELIFSRERNEALKNELDKARAENALLRRLIGQYMPKSFRGEVDREVDQMIAERVQ